MAKAFLVLAALVVRAAGAPTDDMAQSALGMAMPEVAMTNSARHTQVRARASALTCWEQPAGNYAATC